MKGNVMPKHTGSEIKGKLEQIGGTIQSAVGEAIGSPKLEAKGNAHELHGKAARDAAKAAERAEAGPTPTVSPAQPNEVVHNGDHATADHSHLSGDLRKAKPDDRKRVNP